MTDGWFAKFPKDVIYCEQLTNGNPNILNEEPFAEKKKEKVDYSLIFGDPDEIKTKKEEIIQKSVTKRIKSRLAGVEDSPRPQITHPRFLGHSDHTVRILTQPSTPYHVHSEAQDTTAHTADRRQNAAGYACSFCPFTSSRVNVMMMHSKSHSAPDKTSLANFAKSRSVTEARVRSEVRGSRLFADARAGLVKKRKLVYSSASSKSSSEPIKKKTKLVKKQKKKDVVVRDEKKNSIFGDWSEDENEEEEEKVKLQESINNIVDSDSEDERLNFELGKVKDQKNERKRPERNVKKSPEKTKKVKKKVKKRQSATDAVKNLINSSLSRVEESMEEDEIESDNYDDHASSSASDELGLSPAPSPPPTTPSKKPVILKKSSTRSFQLPTRFDGKLELIKHDSKDASDTKYQGLSAKAKAKQLARNQMSSNELFDKLIENDAKKDAKEEDVEKEKKTDVKFNGDNETELTEPSKTLETYDFDIDPEPVMERLSKSPMRTESPAKEAKKVTHEKDVKIVPLQEDSSKSSSPSKITEPSETLPVKPSSTLPSEVPKESSNVASISPSEKATKTSQADSIVKDTDELLASVKDVVKTTDKLLSSSSPQSTVKSSLSKTVSNNQTRVVKVTPPVKVVSPVKVTRPQEEVKPKPTVVVVKPPAKVPVTSPNKVVPSAPKIVKNKTVISPQTIVVEKPAASPTKVLLSPPRKTIIVEKPLVNKSNISLAKPALGPKIISDVKVQNRVVANVSKITLEPPKKVSPLVQQKPLMINNEKPVIAGLGLGSKPVIGGVTKITKNIVLSKPAISSSNTTNPSSPLKVGTKIMTLNQKQESPIKLPSSSITLASKKKEEKPLTISLESNRKTTIKPIVKTVEIPKRVSKMTGPVVMATPVPQPASSSVAKPVVRLDGSDKVAKAPSLEIKLDTKPAAVPLMSPPKPVPVVTEGTEFIVAVSEAALSTTPGDIPVSMDNKVNGGKVVGPAVMEGLELPVGEADGEMIYLLVEDGADPNLENQTLYIDPSQLAAATGGLVLQGDGTMLLSDHGSVVSTQGAGGQLLIQNADGGLSNLVILDDKVCYPSTFTGSMSLFLVSSNNCLSRRSQSRACRAW